VPEKKLAAALREPKLRGYQKNLAALTSSAGNFLWPLLRGHGSASRLIGAARSKPPRSARRRDPLFAPSRKVDSILREIKG
jgi:hypothetical protein